MTDSPSDTPFETLVHAFLADIQGTNSRQAYRHALAAFFRFIDDVAYGGHDEPGPPYSTTILDVKILAEYYRWLDRHYQGLTINTYIAGLKRFLTWLDAGDYLPPDFNLSRAQNTLKATIGKTDKRFYHLKTPDPELPKIITYYDELPLPEVEDNHSLNLRMTMLRNRALFHTLYSTAGRVSEVSGLTRQQVLDGRLDEVTIVGKGNKQRVILLTNEAREAIRAYTKERSDTYPALFIGHSNRSKGKPLNRQNIWQIVKRAAKDLDLHEDTSPHTFRHYRATQLLNEGMSLELVQAYLGHESIETTRKIYAHTHTAVLKENLAQYNRSPKEAMDALAKKRGDTDEAE
ncbi:MAG: tyrosine-type recombinase/integrase [Chloroflexota bacterium]